MKGILVVNKPSGYTSRDIVNIVGKCLGTKKIGHTGTLDPLATGVLVLCIDKGLKLVELLTNHDREYVAKIRLGIETDTYDITGNIINKRDASNIKIRDIERVLKKFLGNIKQEVPIYSSIKVNGKKLYEYARNGEDVVLPVRDVNISNLELTSDIFDGEFTIKCSVSKGTYIRSLVRDIGRELGCGAVMVELERTRLGIFSLEDAYSLEDIKNNKYKLIDIEDAVMLPSVLVNDDLEKKIRNGMVLEKFFDSDMAFVKNSKGILLAIYQKKDDKYVKPYRMFL